MSPTPRPPRNPGLDLLVEQVARVVARARARQGDDAVRSRVDAAISPEDAATAARVLRTLGAELGDAPLDLGALDARLQSLAAGGARPQGAPHGRDADATEDGAATQPDPGADADGRRGRPHPPTGLRSTMRGRRR